MDFLADIEPHIWVLKCLFTIFVGLGLLYLEGRLRDFLLIQTSKTKNVLDDCLVKALDGPLRVLIVFFAFFYILGYAVIEFSSLVYFYDYYEMAKVLAFHVLFLWFAIRFTNYATEDISKLPKSKRKLTKTSISAISKVTVITLSALVVLNIMQPVFGVPISALLAFGGIGGIAVALACQDLLSNVFGGMYIFLDRPFDIGDWISSPEKNIEGVVEEIGLRLTKIRTFDKRVRYVPNSQFSKIIVDNPSRMTHRRIKMCIGIRYDDAALLGKIVKDIDKMMKKCKFIDESMLTYARFLDFSASSIDIEVYCFTKETSRVGLLTAKQELSVKIIDIIAGYGAEMAFPTSTIHIASDTPSGQAQAEGA